MRTLLIILLAFVGMTATLLGMLLIAYPVLMAYGMPVEFLHPAFVKSYILPGTLFIVTGGINLSALLSALQGSRPQYNWSLAGSTIMIAWLVVHSFFLQAIPWVYLIYAICSLLIVLLSWQLKGKWAV